MTATELETLDEMRLDEPSLIDLREHREAIGAALFEHPSRLDLRRLWTRGGLTLFRVNLWGTDAVTGEPKIKRSLFVEVERTQDGLVARDRTLRGAA